MKKIDLKPVGEFLKGICGVAVFGLALFAPRILEINVSKRDDDTESYSYGGAVEVIMDSNMFASDKRRMVDIIEKDRDCDYYKSVIKIIKSNMFASDKIRTVEALK